MLSQPVEKHQKQGGIFHDIKATQVHTHWLKRALDTLSPSFIPPLVHLLVIPTMIHEVIVILKESELHHSIGRLIHGAHPGPKTDRDYLGRYCP